MFDFDIILLMAYITINKTNFYHNLNQIAFKVGSLDKIAIVLKDNAYGHGLVLMAKLASDFGIKHAVVRKKIEADRIRACFETILILGDESVRDERCSFVINTLEDIKCAEKGSKVELKVDTGMHRNGISVDELEEALEQIKLHELNLVGVMTHYRSADVLSSELFWQQKQFEHVKAVIQERGYENVRFHSHNSAAALRSKSFNEDLVRVGIAAYGYHDLHESFDETELKPVLSLYAKKVATRKLQKGQRIGYGGTYTAAKEMVVSTYDIGYGDGWMRASDRTAYITGDGLPVLGRVSMDLISLESEKEELCIMDNAETAASHFGTISYEILTALSHALPREIIEI